MRLLGLAGACWGVAVLGCGVSFAAGPQVLLSCPKHGDMKLANVYVIQMPGDRVVSGNGGMAGTEWDLTQVSLKHGDYLMLDCGYVPSTAAAGTPVATKDHEARKIPADAGRCYMANSPIKAECFARAK